MNANAIDPAPEGGRRKGKAGVLIGLAAGLVLGGGGFFAARSGMVDPAALLGGGHATPEAKTAEIAFIAMEPIMVSLPPGTSARHLRFAGQLEVDPAMVAEVAALMPRVIDALNTYLRAVDIRDFENPAALQKLRAQMLRRVQVVTGEGKVRDLLIAEFVLN